MQKEIKVLVVEDDEFIRRIETSIVQRCHCVVETASNGVEALKLINAKRFDLVFMDIGLPDTTGLELTKKIRMEKSENQTVPVVALTAHADSENQEKAMAVGMNSYLVKPLTVERCEQILKEYVHQ